MKFWILAPFAIVLAFGISCSRQRDTTTRPAPKEDVIATVGMEEISTGDFTSRATERRAPDTPAARAALLEEMIEEEALVQQARAAGLDQTPEYRRALRQFLITRHDELHLQPLLARADIISDEELAEACHAATPRYTKPAARRLAWIKITSGQNDPAEALQRLTMAAEKFRGLPPDASRIGFGQVAAEYSEDTDTRYQGGDLGWVAETEYAAKYPAQLAQTAKTLQLGQPSAPVVLADGVYLLLAAQERPPTPLPPEALKERVKQELITARRAEAKANFRRTARAAISVKIHNDVLEKTPITLVPGEAASPPAP